jgi:hypothetical protein
VGEDRTVTVCSMCLTAACWRGWFYCTDHQTAGTVDIPLKDLCRMDLENPCFWSIDTVEELGVLQNKDREPGWEERKAELIAKWKGGHS